MPTSDVVRRGGRHHPGLAGRERTIRPVPDHVYTVTSRLALGDGAAGIDFYTAPFDAEELGERYHMPDGTLVHAELLIGDRGFSRVASNPSLGIVTRGDWQFTRGSRERTAITSRAGVEWQKSRAGEPRPGAGDERRRRDPTARAWGTSETVALQGPGCAIDPSSCSSPCPP